ncbi:MAG: shikimate dehydrogenase [Helicobacter sp.]|uniref:shikimate dehydrogenase n=1 Tax=Helicobacter sp. TaxID=218 RepID=UPI0023D5122E|nr:shikimate dehydrogenase [Helicobacter sp.]MDE5925360.1 shikimate dehydrogenase [Helicobacter sp.]MDE7175416.1 shikimate dehydrogenase [Helicobacter sp.]
MQFAVIGNPIHHSLSPILHNSAFKALGVVGFYGRYLLENPKKFSSLKNLHLTGANITVPFKEIAFKSCDEVFGIAQEIGAVNTLVFEKEKMLGYNTDALGFYQCIESLNPKNALILGAGGSAKALACILKEKNIATTIINRSQSRLESFIALGFHTATFENFTPKECFDLIINTTPAGLTNDSLPLDSAILTPLLDSAKFAFDLVYGRETPFLTLAKSLNIPNSDGKQMLINQAILAFEIFMESQKIPIDKTILHQSMQTAL